MDRDRHRIAEIQRTAKQHGGEPDQETERNIQPLRAGQDERSEPDGKGGEERCLPPLARGDPGRGARDHAHRDNADTGWIEQVLAAIADQEFG